MSPPNEEFVEADKKGVKRKKKRSVNQMAKKLARRRVTADHGCELEPDTYQYMVRILDVLRTDFPTMDDKFAFTNNIYEQTIGNEIALASNQVASRVLDSLMKYASLEAIQRLADALSPSLRPLCNDRFASHVLEQFIYTCADRGNEKLAVKDEAVPANDQQPEIKPNDVARYNNLALKLCKYAINNIEEFIYEPYANHVLRAAVRCLGGYVDRVQDPKDKQKTISCFDVKRKMHEEYTDLLVAMTNRLLKWPQFAEFGRDELTSGFLQTLLQSTKLENGKLANSIIKKITTDCFASDSENISNVFDTESSCRLLETCLAVASPKRFKKLHTQYFAKNLGQLSTIKSSNFSVQRLLDYCPTKEIFEEIFDEISEHIGKIVEMQFTGILASLSNACLRLQAKQGPFIAAVSKSLDCDEPAERQLLLVPLVASLITFEQLESAKKAQRVVPIHLHGSLVLQATLRFNKPIKIVNSILAMLPEDLVRLLSDPKGSRILDAFMDSKFVGEKSREKLFKLMKDHWVELAHGIHGSRCIDKMWEYIKGNQRVQVMEELAAVGQTLMSSKTGRLIFNKLNVALFAKNKKDWLEVQGKPDKTKSLFSEIINSDVKKTV